MPRDDFWPWFGKRLRRVAHSRAGYALLDKYHLVMWGAGGCYAMALALKALLDDPAAHLVAITHGDDWLAQHVLVEIDGYYLDGDGASTRAQLLTRWRKEEGLRSPRIVALRDARLDPSTKRAQIAVADTMKLLESAFGRHR
jgi:hypothetical protein